MNFVSTFIANFCQCGLICPAIEEGILFSIADFIKDERRCCAFIHYGMEVEPHGKGIWLMLKGGAVVKDAIREEMFGLLPDGVQGKVA